MSKAKALDEIFPEGDTVLVCQLRLKDRPSSVPGSTQQQCELCEAPVWASPNSMNAVLDNIGKNGGKLHLICLGCVPLGRDSMLPTDAQKEEMRAAGVDFDKAVNESGYAPEQWIKLEMVKYRIIKMMATLDQEGKLQRAANAPNTEDVTLEDGRVAHAVVNPALMLLCLKMLGHWEQGAIPCFRRIRKTNSEPNDFTPTGTEGEVLGSLRPPGDPIILEGLVVHYGYCVIFDNAEVPVFILDNKIEEV